MNEEEKSCSVLGEAKAPDSDLTWLGSGYEWTITIHVQESDPTGSDVGSYSSDWEYWLTH